MHQTTAKLRQLDEAERAAWDDYLETTRGSESYREIEAWAWAKLQTVLRRIKRERKKVAA